MRILYAGDSPEGGPANYLLGILRLLKADFLHLPPSEMLTSDYLRKPYDAIILSDFSENHVPEAAQEIIAKQVSSGTGLLMIGGWGSFSGPFGGWRGSKIEKILPVNCQPKDDRTNFPGGALMTLKNQHPMFRSLSFQDAPVICGLNHLKPKKNSRVVLTARKILKTKGINPKLSLDKTEYPLLIVDSDPGSRIAALATDLAPHWCGGLLDWGKVHKVLPVKDKIKIEIADGYIRFVSSLLRWLTRS